MLYSTLSSRGYFTIGNSAIGQSATGTSSLCTHLLCVHDNAAVSWKRKKTLKVRRFICSFSWNFNYENVLPLWIYEWICCYSFHCALQSAGDKIEYRVVLCQTLDISLRKISCVKGNLLCQRQSCFVLILRLNFLGLVALIHASNLCS